MQCTFVAVPLAGQPLSFEWHAFGPRLDALGGLPTIAVEEDDPLGLAAKAETWKPMRIGAKRITMDPDTVCEGDFVIVRAPAADEFSFHIGDIDVPLWLCKVRAVVGAERATRCPQCAFLILMSSN